MSARLRHLNLRSRNSWNRVGRFVVVKVDAYGDAVTITCRAPTYYRSFRVEN